MIWFFKYNVIFYNRFRPPCYYCTSCNSWRISRGSCSYNGIYFSFYGIWYIYYYVLSCFNVTYTTWIFYQLVWCTRWKWSRISSFNSWYSICSYDERMRGIFTGYNIPQIYQPQEIIYILTIL